MYGLSVSSYHHRPTRRRTHHRHLGALYSVRRDLATYSSRRRYQSDRIKYDTLDKAADPDEAADTDCNPQGLGSQHAVSAGN